LWVCGDILDAKHNTDTEMIMLVDDNPTNQQVLFQTRQLNAVYCIEDGPNILILGTQIPIT